MTLRLCVPLGDDWPTLPHCTACLADIHPRQRYAIVPGTLTVLCAPCAGQPAAGSVSTRRDENGISTLTRPARSRRSHQEAAP